MSLSLQLLANGLVNGVLYALLAVGFGLAFRSLRVFHVAYGGLFALSCYSFWVLREAAGFATASAAVLAILVSFVAGWLTEIYLYRPLYVRHAGAGATIVASLGLYVVLENALALGFGNELKVVSRPATESVAIGPVFVSGIQIFQVMIGTVCLAMCSLAVARGGWFSKVWAMGDEPRLLAVLGVPLYRYRALILGLSAAVAAVPACLITLDLGVRPQVGLSYLLIAAVAVLAGGVDRFGAWIAGGFLLALLQSLVVWGFAAHWMDLVAFALLVVVLIIRPEGVFGIRKRLEET